MRLVIITALALAACSQPKEEPLRSCEDVEPLTADMPLHTFMALNTDRACDFAGTCQYGQAQVVCGEESEIGEVECKCMDGAFKCFDTQEKVDAMNEVCSS